MNPNTIATLISVEADADKKLPERIQLLRVGKFDTQKYGNLEITADDMTEFVDHFRKGYGRPGPEGSKGGLPVNLRHDKGGVAAAWINNVEFDGKNLWGTNLEWTGAGKAEVEAGNYKYLSSEFTPRCLGGLWTNSENTAEKIRNVFTGAALTNIPMFSGNHGVMASAESSGSGDEKQVIYINASDEERKHKMLTLDEVRVKDVASLTDDDKKVLADALFEDHTSLSADEKKKFFGIEASTTDKPKTVEASAVTGSEGLVTVEASQIKALNEKVAAAESEKTDLEKKVEAHGTQLADFRKKEVEASVDQHIARGAIIADQRDAWVEKILADASNEKLLEGIASNKNVEAENLGKDTKGDGAVSATNELNVEAQKLIKIEADAGREMTLAQAYVKVTNDNPELSKRVSEERAGQAE